MSKMTLLELVQDIHNSLDFDEINSINDTQESSQVAQIVKTAYFEIINRKDWPHLKEMFQLDASGDNAKPTHMKIPSTIREMDEINYDSQKSGDSRNKYVEVKYLYPDEFLKRANTHDSSDTNVTTITDFSGIKVNIRTDKAPTYWTSFDDEYVVFNQHDSAVDTTLQKSKTQCHGIRVPTFTLSDSFTPDLPIDAFPLLLAEAKSTASFQLRQLPDEKAEQQARRQHLRQARKNWSVRDSSRFPDYGRKKNINSWGR